MLIEVDIDTELSIRAAKVDLDIRKALAEFLEEEGMEYLEEAIEDAEEDTL